MSILFYLFAILLIVFSLSTVQSRNLVHSALFMLGSFVMMAGLYLLLEADYLAMVQILVYVGAISVLVVFGVMLTRRGDMSESNLANRYIRWGGLIALAFLGLLIRAISHTIFPAAQSINNVPVLEQIATTLLTDYVVAFEIIGIVLLVAIIGAIIIGKENK